MTGERGAEVERQQLTALLKGREERAYLQKFLLQTSPTVLQISLNIPGLPKRLDGDALAIQKAEAALPDAGVRSIAKIALTNAAGLCLLLSCDNPAHDIKFGAISLEEKLPWGRALDLDVLTASGPLSREDLGQQPRSCLLCGGTAKACARSGKHGLEDLRTGIAALLKLCVKHPDF